MADYSLILQCGPVRLCLKTPCERMVRAFGESPFTATMLPSYHVHFAENTEQLFTVFVLPSAYNGFEMSLFDARFYFYEAQSGDNKEVYFEVIFFLQTWFAQELQKQYKIYMLKAAMISCKGQTLLISGQTGSGKSSLLSACLPALAGHPFHFFDGKVLLNENLFVVGGNTGLSSRRLLPHADPPVQKELRQVAVDPLPLMGIPLSATLSLRIEAFSPPELYHCVPYPPSRAISHLFKAASFYPNGEQSTLHFFSMPLPDLNTAATRAQRYRFATACAQRPVWKAYGSLERMSAWVLEHFFEL